MILKPKKIKSLTVSIVSPSVCHEMMELDAMILIFWMLSFKSAFWLSSFTLKRFFTSSSLSAFRVVVVVVQSLSCVQLFVTPWTAARFPCSSLSPGVCSDPCPLSRWCYLTISSSAALFSFCLQSFPASGSFPMSWLFTLGGQSIALQHQSFQWIFKTDFL